MTPLSYWIYFHVALVALLGAEYLVHRAVPDIRRKAMVATGMWVGAALVLAVVLSRVYRVEGATQYLAGYALEQAMSLDNLFVFLLLFRVFRIPAGKQPKVLFWGVAGAIVLRGLFIASGVGLLNRFHWIEYVFGGLLLVAAVLSITRQPFLAYTSNIMAVMGLRSLYVLLAAGLAKLKYLHFGLAAVLGFAAVKMLLADWVVIGPLVSLAVIAGLMAITVGLSVLMARETRPTA